MAGKISHHVSELSSAGPGGRFLVCPLQAALVLETHEPGVHILGVEPSLGNHARIGYPLVPCGSQWKAKETSNNLYRQKGSI
eukprot:scaffold526223_cov51-Prasinocladus_malaysianus.AAC.1